RVGGCVRDFAQLRNRPELVVIAADKKLGKSSVVQEAVLIIAAVGVGGKTEGDDGARVGAYLALPTTRPQSHRRAETESGNHHRPLIFTIEPVERRFHVAHFCFAVALPLAEARATKVEAQHRKAEAP